MPEEAAVKGGDKRRTIESSKSGVKGVKGSTGSCHDFCKHGENDESMCQVGESRPWRKSVTEIGGNTVRAKDIGITDVVNKNVVVRPKPLSGLRNESPAREKGKQVIVAKSELVDVLTEDSLPSEEKVKQDNLVASEESSTGAKDVDLFKQSCKLSKGKPSLLRMPSIISSGSSVGRNIDPRKIVEGGKSVDGKKVLQGSKSFDGRKVVQGSKGFDGKQVAQVRKSFNGRKLSDESKIADTEITQKDDKIADAEITQKDDGNANVESYKEGSKSADEMKIMEGSSKRSPAKKGLERSKSLNLKTNIKVSGSLNGMNVGKSETLKKQVIPPKPRILSSSPSRTLNNVASKPSGGSRTKASELDGKKVSTSTIISPSSSNPSVKRQEHSDTKMVRVARLISTASIPSKTTNEAAKGLNDQGMQEETMNVIKPSPAKKSLASTKMKMASGESLLSAAPPVTKSTARSRTSYLPSSVKKSPEESKQKLKAKDSSSSGRLKIKAVDLDSEKQKPSKIKVRSSTMVAETTPRRSYLKKDGPSGNVHKNISDKFLPGFRRKKTVQVLSNKVIEDTANRLIRTRKSKVLALIGAFETVISIHKKSARATSKTKKRIASSKISR